MLANGHISASGSRDRIVIRPTCHLLSRIHAVETVSRPVSRTLETIVAMRVLTMRSGRSVQVLVLASTSDVARLLPTDADRADGTDTSWSVGSKRATSEVLANIDT